MSATDVFSEIHQKVFRKTSTAEERQAIARMPEKVETSQLASAGTPAAQYGCQKLMCSAEIGQTLQNG
jgi:hypothetical protein